MKTVLIFSISLIPALAGALPSIAGDYSVSNVTTSADRVQLTLRLRLRNAEATPLHGAQVSLRTRAGDALLRGGVDLDAGTSLNFTSDVVLTPVEYRLLQRGANPSIVIETLDSAGTPVKSFAVLVRKMVSGGAK